MTTENDKEKLLRMLHAHGQQFLSTFDMSPPQKSETEDLDGSDPEEEWSGLSPANRGTSETASDGEHDDERKDNNLATNAMHTPDVTIFIESTRKSSEASLSAKELRKSFMSSKVSNIISSSMQPISKEKVPDEESDDEWYEFPTLCFIQDIFEGSNLLASTNAQNDALLHRLVHTKLLSGSLNPELDLNHAQRGRALAGRVLELAGEAKLGKGESMVRQEQRNKAAKRVRDGLIRKKREHEKMALEEAKDLGNYHPTLKRFYDLNSSSTQKKKRGRGLGMGIGRFVKGTLKLSQEEITSMTGPERGSRGDDRRAKRQRPCSH